MSKKTKKIIKKKLVKKPIKRNPSSQKGRLVKKTRSKLKTAKQSKKKVTRKKVLKKPVKRSNKKTIRKRIIKKKVVKKTRSKSRTPKRIRRKTKTTIKKKVRRVRKASHQSPLEQLFESSTKVQVMKLFFHNPEEILLLPHIVKRLRINSAKVKKEVKRLEKVGFLKTKQVSARKQSFFLNSNFDFLNELQELILKSAPISKERMVRAIKRIGRIKLILLSGIFLGENNFPKEIGATRADLLIVGDKLNQRKLGTLIKDLEAEAGTGINCVALGSEEFDYRYNMYDRFIRDLLTEKSEILINKLDISIL